MGTGRQAGVRTGAKLLSVLGFLAMVAGLVALAVTRTLFSTSFAAGIAQAAAIALMVWARLTFGRRSFHLRADPTEGGLVTTGPYAAIRHPIYAAVTLLAWGSVIGTPSDWTALCAAVVTAGALARIACEERLLVERYPEYAEYAGRTKRLVPFVW